MTEATPAKRPSLHDVEEYLKYLTQISSNLTTENSFREGGA
jgi:hypothetical protein